MALVEAPRKVFKYESIDRETVVPEVLRLLEFVPSEWTPYADIQKSQGDRESWATFGAYETLAAAGYTEVAFAALTRHGVGVGQRAYMRNLALTKEAGGGQ